MKFIKQTIFLIIYFAATTSLAIWAYIENVIISCAMCSFLSGLSAWNLASTYIDDYFNKTTKP